MIKEKVEAAKVKELLSPCFNVSFFGLFEGSDFAKFNSEISEDFENYKSNKAILKKSEMLDYLKQLTPFIYVNSSSKDFISGKEIADPVFYKDGNFVFTSDVIYYLENYGINLPAEYQEFVKMKKEAEENINDLVVNEATNFLKEKYNIPETSDIDIDIVKGKEDILLLVRTDSEKYKNVTGDYFYNLFTGFSERVSVI